MVKYDPIACIEGLISLTEIRAPALGLSLLSLSKVPTPVYVVEACQLGSF